MADFEYLKSVQAYSSKTGRKPKQVLPAVLLTVGGGGVEPPVRGRWRQRRRRGGRWRHRHVSRRVSFLMNGPKRMVSALGKEKRESCKLECLYPCTRHTDISVSW